MQVAGTGPTLHSTYGAPTKTRADLRAKRESAPMYSSGVHMQVAGSGPTLHSAYGAQTKTRADLHTKSESAPVPPILHRLQHAGGRHWPDPAQHLRCLSHM